MPTLRALVASGQPTTRGFRSLAEVDSTVVADPLPVYMIGHTSVTGWSAGQDPHALLIDRQERLLPLVVSGEVRSSATTKERSPGVWEVAEFDYGPLAKAAADARSALARSRGVDPASVTLVEIPTLSAHLLGDEENGALMLTPIFDVPGTSLVAGQTVPASVALPALQPLALTVNLNAPD
jgi:hypothetical protein